MRQHTPDDRRSSRWWPLAALLGGLLAGGVACTGTPGTPPAGGGGAAADPPPDPALFRDVTAESGVNFTYRNGDEAGHYAILESLGGGVALIDYDRDGLLDIFVTGGGYFDGPDKKEIRGHPGRLYKNLGGWKFQDVTREAGVDRPLFYTHGCAVADYDADGWPDLLVTGWGRLALYHNEPDGQGGRHFVEVTEKAGLTDTLWSTSAAWADFDGDGCPDLYVCHYVNWSFDNHPECPGYAGDVRRDICPPKQFRALPHVLYRNNGNGTFTDVTKEAGLREDGKGLGVLAVDVNDDGKPDLYVANDTDDNFLYLNRSRPGQIRFEEVGLPSGVARSEGGVADGSMGVDAADYDGSGRASLWVTNYENEMHGLYRNLGTGSFLFSTGVSGVAAIGRVYVGFGTAFADIDLDGREDLVVANGHVIRHSPRLRQRPVLLRNEGDGRFRNVTDQGGPYFRDGHLGRGLVVGDLDNDGRPDLVVSHLNEPLVLLRNEAPPERHWLGVELAGRDNRDVAGARLVLEAGGRRQTRFAKGGGSYLSSGDRRLLFGLGTAERIDRLTVVWPSGRTRQWDGDRLAADRYHRLAEEE
jgi:enediyne biosynthesis protein E4